MDLRVSWELGDRGECSRVSNVHQVDVVVDDHNHDGAGAGLVVRLVGPWGRNSEEIFLCLVGALSDGFRDVLREFRLQDDVVVELVLEVLCTFAATVAIENSENLKPWPDIYWNLRLLGNRLNNVKDDRNPVLVRLANSSYICVSCKCFD